MPDLLDLSEYPRFSLGEREQRWARVRQLMRERQCDCLVAPEMGPCEQQATGRYLSQMGGEAASAWVVFPLDGEVTAIVDNDRRKEFFSHAQDWVTDIRPGSPTELVPARLRELGLDQGRIGFTEYQGCYRNPEGSIPAETMHKMQDALPNAHIYGENEALDLARVVKSPEEIGVIERVVAANEEAIQVMCDTARPGVPQEDVWVAMANSLTRATRAYPQRLSVTAAGPANYTSGMPIPDPIPPGALISQEINARLQGYGAQSNHTIQVGDGGPADYPDVMRATIDVYREMAAWMGPGKTIGELCEHYLQLCEKAGATDASGVVVHTNGLGSDYPRIGPRMMRGNEASLVLQPGMAFTFKPVLRFPTGTRAQFGDPLAITESGARRLGQRPMVPIVVR